MRVRGRCFILVVGLVVLTGLNFTQKANASIFISEILADPPSGTIGDANGDGVTSSRDDEFVELFNLDSQAIDISGWSIADGVQTRHVFGLDTILNPYNYIAVFGKDASTGLLGLNNSGDVVSLFNLEMELIDRVSYGSIGGRDQSIVRFPEIEEGEWILHSRLDSEKGLFSPGEGPYVEINDGNTVVTPELPSYIYLLLGLCGIYAFARPLRLVLE